MALGFTKEEARIYIICLQSGPSPISAIAKWAATKRQTCLYTIKNLIEKGYVSSAVRDSVPYYTAEHPSILIAKSEERSKIATELIPELLSITNTLTTKPKIRYYQWEGIATALWEIRKHDHVSAITNLDLAIEDHLEELKAFRRNRAEGATTRTRILTARTERVLEFLQSEPLPDGDSYRFIDPSEFRIENDLVILDNKVIVLSIPRTESYALWIESNSYCTTQKAIFEALWKHAERYTP